MREKPNAELKRVFQQICSEYYVVNAIQILCEAIDRSSLAIALQNFLPSPLSSAAPVLINGAELIVH